MLQRESIEKWLSKHLKAPRFEHSLSVEKVAIDLARHHGVSVEAASISALLHDCSRWMEGRKLLMKAEEIGIPIDPVQRFEPKLLHAAISAHLTQEEFGIKDKNILQAIERHTVGDIDMTALDKIIYLADHIEPERDFLGVEAVRSLAYTDMDAAIVKSADAMIRYLLDSNLPIFPKTVMTRNYYLMKKYHG